MTRQVKCPGCERILRVPKSNSRDVQMRCKHCGTPFLASLMGHIDLEETQMATSKNAAKAATKAKAVGAAKKAKASNPKDPVKAKTATGGNTAPAKKQKGKVAWYSPTASKNPKIRSGSTTFDIYASLYSSKKAKTTEEIIAGIPKDRQKGVTKVTVYNALRAIRAGDTVACVFK